MPVQRLETAPDLVVVKARIVGPRRPTKTFLILDTGAATTLIDPDILLAAGYEPGKPIRRQAMTTASGYAYAPVLVIRKIEILGLSVKNIEVVAHSLPPNIPFRGLLGMNFLRQFNVHLEFLSRQMWIEPA